jgi:hypothetical protein
VTDCPQTENGFCDEFTAVDVSGKPPGRTSAIPDTPKRKESCRQWRRDGSVLLVSFM